MRQEKELDSPYKLLVLQEVLSSSIHIALSTLLGYIQNLGADLAAWLEGEGSNPQEEIKCYFIEEGVDRQNIVLASWEGDASNVMLPMTHKNYQPIPSIVDGGLGIKIISKRLYDE